MTTATKTFGFDEQSLKLWSNFVAINIALQITLWNETNEHRIYKFICTDDFRALAPILKFLIKGKINPNLKNKTDCQTFVPMKTGSHMTNHISDLPDKILEKLVKLRKRS